MLLGAGGFAMSSGTNLGAEDALGPTLSTPATAFSARVSLAGE